MSRWEIKLPIRSPDDTLAELGCNASVLASKEDRRVVREVALVAAQAGCRNVSDVEWVFNSFDPPTRRWALSRLRERAGLETIEQIEARDRSAALARIAPPHVTLTLSRSGAIVETPAPSPSAGMSAANLPG
jgi:hypothetical protein